MDATYRADLRELKELDANWGTGWTELDAKLERRLTELRGEIRTELADINTCLWCMLALWPPTALAVMVTGSGMISLLLRR